MVKCPARRPRESDKSLAGFNISRLPDGVNHLARTPEMPKAERPPQVAQRPAALRRAAVFVAIQEVLEDLPQKYSDDDCRVKCEAVYQHVYDSYYGSGGNAYGAAG
jgi:hypothetical protein